MLRPGVLRVSDRSGSDVRSAHTADFGAVCALLRSADLPLAGVPESLEGFLVAEDSGVVVGVAGLEVHGRDGVLRSVAVAPDQRGRGLGARLTASVLDRAREQRLGNVYLLTTTADAWFPRHGFRRIARDAASPEVAESIEFREACPASAVAMVLELDPER